MRNYFVRVSSVLLVIVLACSFERAHSYQHAPKASPHLPSLWKRHLHLSAMRSSNLTCSYYFEGQGMFPPPQSARVRSRYGVG